MSAETGTWRFDGASQSRRSRINAALDSGVLIHRLRMSRRISLVAVMLAFWSGPSNAPWPSGQCTPGIARPRSIWPDSSIALMSRFEELSFVPCELYGVDGCLFATDCTHARHGSSGMLDQETNTGSCQGLGCVACERIDFGKRPAFRYYQFFALPSLSPHRHRCRWPLLHTHLLSTGAAMWSRSSILSCRGHDPER